MRGVDTNNKQYMNRASLELTQDMARLGVNILRINYLDRLFLRSAVMILMLFIPGIFVNVSVHSLWKRKLDTNVWQDILQHRCGSVCISDNRILFFGTNKVAGGHHTPFSDHISCLVYLTSVVY